MFFMDKPAWLWGKVHKRKEKRKRESMVRVSLLRIFWIRISSLCWELSMLMFCRWKNRCRRNFLQSMMCALDWSSHPPRWFAWTPLQRHLPEFSGNWWPSPCWKVSRFWGSFTKQRASKTYPKVRRITRLTSCVLPCVQGCQISRFCKF